MNPLLKLSIKIEKLLTQINHSLPVRAWYAILLLTILGSVFFSNYFGPEINSAFAILWLFALIIVIFEEVKPSQNSYLVLILASLLFLVFVVLVSSSILRYL